MVDGMADNKKLNWLHTSDLWRVEVDQPTPTGARDAYRGATYQIRKHGSPPVFELRWLWHPDFSDRPPNKREELERNYTEWNWKLPSMVRQFDSLAEAMNDAQEMEKYRLGPRHAMPPAVLEEIRVEFASDEDGDRYALVDDQEADMAGWKIETIDTSLSAGVRHIVQFKRDTPLPYARSYQWSADCDWGVFIVRWIPPVTTAKRTAMLELVKERHAHQTRNGKAETEYWKHCKGAADILEEAITEQSDMTESPVVENVYLAALGHDLYEDGKPEVKPEDIAVDYGQEVADLIAEVTNRKDDEHRDDYLEQLRTASDEAILIKYADQIDNAESIDAHLNDFEPGEASRYVRMLKENFDVLDEYQFKDQWRAIGQALRNRLARTWPQLLSKASAT